MPVYYYVPRADYVSPNWQEKYEKRYAMMETILRGMGIGILIFLILWAIAGIIRKFRRTLRKKFEAHEFIILQTSANQSYGRRQEGIEVNEQVTNSRRVNGAMRDDQISEICDLPPAYEDLPAHQRSD